MSGLREEITRRIFPHRRSVGRTRAREGDDLGETLAPTDPREGKQFGAYRVLRRLGSGGMGQVYLALDTRLGRHVALKFLPPELLLSGARFDQLKQEARCASSLNHPNILTIYEIAQFEGEYFIASEFVEGVTLRSALARDLVTPEMAVRIAVQIASALMAAHATGVIHRDLKPANIMVRPDGYVKVIDFGLAKLMEDDLEGEGAGHSQGRALIGTVEYMSPEQARGDDVDARTDLWSLGVLFYEMLQTERPFTGDTHSHVLVAILDRPVPPLKRLGTLPDGAEKIVERALAKNPARRYASAEQVLADLEKLSTPSARFLAAPFFPPPGGRPRWLVAGGIAALLLALAGFGFWWTRMGGRDLWLGPDWFRVESVRQLTFNGRTTLAAISPDGKYLAFVVGDTGRMQSLHVKRVDQPSEAVLAPSRNIDYLGLTFSPDSSSIYEVEKDTETLLGKLFVIPVPGERPVTPILQDIDGPVSFNPEGDKFVFVRYRELPGGKGYRDQLETAQADGSGRRVLFASDRVPLLARASWSPDGRKVAVFSIDAGASGQPDLALVSPDGRLVKKPLPNWNYLKPLGWTPDSRSILLTASSSTESRNREQLREVFVGTGQTHDTTRDLSGYKSGSLTRDGRLLAAVKVNQSATLWISKSNDFEHGRSTMSEEQDSASLAWLDGQKLLVNSRRTGYPNLALLQAADQQIASITNEPYTEEYAVPVADRKALVFCSNRAGGFHIWRYDTQSNRYTQLTFGSTYDEKPAVTPDGRWVVYTAWVHTDPHLFRVPVAGGAPEALGHYRAKEAQISPDGKTIACLLQDPAHRWSVGLLDSGTGALRSFVSGVQTPFHWSAAGDALTSSITDENGVSNVWLIPLNGGSWRRLTDFDDQSIVAFSLSPTGDKLACLRLTLGSDAVLFRSQR